MSDKQLGEAKTVTTETYRIHHMCISVRGALRNWDPRMWRDCVTDNSGNTLKSNQVRDWLLDELSKGHEKVPMDPACDNFDYTQHGCRGHVVDKQQSASPRESQQGGE